VAVNPRYLDGRYERDHPTWHEERASWKADQVAEMFARNTMWPSCVVDIGCGTGGVVRELAVRFPATRILGVDPSPQAAALAKESCTPTNADIVQDLIENIDETFDMALMLDVFEHVDDYVGFLRSVRSIAPRVIFHIPLDMNALTIVRDRALDHKRSVVGHLHYFNRLSALATLSDCGYRVIDDFYTASSYQGAGRDLSSKIKSLPRRAMFAMDPHLSVNLLGGYSLCVLAASDSPPASDLDPDRAEAVRVSA
jgi:SAM-dependent methyltransferase